MDDKEKEVQRALGTLTYYIVSLEIRKRAIMPYISTRFLAAGSESDAIEEAICKYMQLNSTVRRDQISVVRVAKANFGKWRK